MKTQKKSIIFLAAVMFALITACAESNDTEPEIELPLTFMERFEARTMDPAVTETGVMFHGVVSKIEANKEVKYGFMWYRESESEPVIHTLEIGVKSTTGQFSLEVSDLPEGETLIVCAYVESLDIRRDQAIGDEVPFTL